jgi:hypothetical protein
MYVSGLAVEGMLRSLCCLKSKEFDEKHDLRRFAVRVGDLGLLRGSRDDDFVGAVGTVAKWWRNNLRYADSEQLRRFLRTVNGTIGRPGALKHLTKEYYDRSSEIVRRCEVLWQRSQKRS